MISHEFPVCANEQFWRQTDGCQCNQIDNVVTEEPQRSCSPFNKSLGEQHYPHKEDEVAFISSVNELLVEYSKHLNSESRIVSSGGVQQLINKKSMAGAIAKADSSQPRRGAGSESTTFHDLPDSLQLHIFSFLGAQELCRISQVCHHWLMLSSDDLLWHCLLQEDVQRWKRISHTTLPSMYKECQSDWSNKQIYLKCSPEISNLMRQNNLNFHNLSGILRSFLPRKNPKFAMFGPGLESSTRRIARNILEDTSGLFKVKGMFPGMSEGVGSGFTIKLPNNFNFRLCMLYTTTRQERENLAAGDRIHANRMLVHEADREEERAQTHFEVRPAVRELCRTLDGFLFVVDASADSATVQSSAPELKAMLHEVWASPNVPLLVLAAVRNGNTRAKRSAVEISEDLALEKLSRPWQVECCEVESMGGVTDAIQWAVEVAQRQ